MEFLRSLVRTGLKGRIGELHTLHPILYLHFDLLGPSFVFYVVVHGHSFYCTMNPQGFFLVQGFSPLLLVEECVLTLLQVQVRRLLERVEILPPDLQIEITCLYGLQNQVYPLSLVFGDGALKG